MNFDYRQINGFIPNITLVTFAKNNLFLKILFYEEKFKINVVSS